VGDAHRQVVGDETGAVAALEDAGVPILVQAYPDEWDKMSPALRRDKNRPQNKR